MKNQFTPGPWTVGTNGHKLWINGPDDDGAKRVADCGPDESDSLGWVSEIEQSFNTRLIATAPELLEALQGYQQLCNNLAVALTPEQISDATNSLTAHCHVSRAAIAKATGGEV